MEEPFDILRKAGVVLSNGKNLTVMFDAFIDLWNFTPRACLWGENPAVYYQRGLRDGRDRRKLFKESYRCLSGRNLHLVTQLAFSDG